MTEQWDAYLRNGSKTDQLLTRGQPIPDGLYHLVVEALIFHTDGSLLFVRRASTKASFPNYWECSCGGSALAGEIAEQAIRRETSEETGLTLDSLTHHKTIIDDRYQCLFEIFTATTQADKTSISLQAEETSDYIWVSPTDLPNFMATQPLIPSQKETLQQLFPTTRD